MCERHDNKSPETGTRKMSDGDLGTRKTLFVLVIVVGCFAVLWPKVFHPMMSGPTSPRLQPSDLDKGCCDVISDLDVNTIKIMSELCSSITTQGGDKQTCREKVLGACGIDISAVLQEKVRLGHSFKQIVEEVRSLNGSLCLKYQFGVAPWRLGVSHRVAAGSKATYVRQERPSHIRPEMLHPALREKGRAIAQPHRHPAAPTKNPQAKFVDGRPGPVPGVRPPMGGAGHVIHPQQKGLNSMGVIMPIYTIGIVIFFSYTLMKLLFKKKREGPDTGMYPPIEPSMSFRRDVFESVQKSRVQPTAGSTRLVTELAYDDVIDIEPHCRCAMVNIGQLCKNGSWNKTDAHLVTELPYDDVIDIEPHCRCAMVNIGQLCKNGFWNKTDARLVTELPYDDVIDIEPHCRCAMVNIGQLCNNGSWNKTDARLVTELPYDDVIDIEPHCRCAMVNIGQLCKNGSWNTTDGDEELDHLRRRLRETELAMERIVTQMARVPLRSQKATTTSNGQLANGSAKLEHEQPSVRVLGMETSASCEGGQRWSRPESPVMPSPPPIEPVDPPQEIYLEGALPAQSQLLVTDATIETEEDSSQTNSDPAVVLASKMTLSVISGDAHDPAPFPLGAPDDEDESRYTTASAATGPVTQEGEEEEEEEVTDDEGCQIEDERVVGNGVPEEVLDEEEEEEEEDESDEKAKIEDAQTDSDDGEIEDEECAVDSNGMPEVRDENAEIEVKSDITARIAPEDLKTVGRVIDDVISAGTRTISALNAPNDAETEESEEETSDED